MFLHQSGKSIKTINFVMTSKRAEFWREPDKSLVVTCFREQTYMKDMFVSDVR